MTPQVTEQIRQALEAQRGEPVRIVDEQTRRVYYVISAEQFEAVRAVLTDEEFQPRELYPLIAKTAEEAGWDSPAMDAYDAYDEHRPQD